MRLQADKREDVKAVYSGEIAAAVGERGKNRAHALRPSAPIALESIVFPEPVVSMRIEPNTKSRSRENGHRAFTPFG